MKKIITAAIAAFGIGSGMADVEILHYRAEINRAGNTDVSLWFYHDSQDVEVRIGGVPVETGTCWPYLALTGGAWGKVESGPVEIFEDGVLVWSASL